jgi:hypothetical protein
MLNYRKHVTIILKSTYLDGLMSGLRSILEFNPNVTGLPPIYHPFNVGETFILASNTV